MIHAPRRTHVPALLLAAVAATAIAHASAAPSKDWTQWRGPDRNNVSTETGLLKQWPNGGPDLLWTAQGIGAGFATVAVADGLIYTAGNVGRDTLITALTLDGKTRWRATNGPASKHQYAGSRGTPTIDGGRLYHESPMGQLVCLDAKTGKKLWGLSLMEKFGGRNISWGLSESVLIDGNNLICCPGGRDAGVVALDKMTGDTVWVCRETRDKPGYASPIVVSSHGLRQIVTMTAKAAVGLNAKTGKLLWRHEHKTSYDANIPTPIYHKDHLFINSGYGSGGALLRLLVRGNTATVREVWSTKGIDNHHGGVVLVDGYLYGTTHRGKWVCLEFTTGKVMYTDRGIGKGSLTYADGMLYTYSEGGGHVALVKTTPDSHQIVSRFKVPRKGRGPHWAHPVVCGGRLYLRHGNFLFCYDIKAR